MKITATDLSSKINNNIQEDLKSKIPQEELQYRMYLYNSIIKYLSIEITRLINSNDDLILKINALETKINKIEKAGT